MSGPTPDLEPRVDPTAPGGEACGCCAGVVVATPEEIQNREGLAAIAYRIGDHARFRASLHAALSSSGLAPLAALRTRDEDDFTIGLIDAFACAADVLTFYQERIANESFLRTATERLSLQEMGKLIGYRLRPGVAAETSLAFALETPPSPPPTLPPEPGNFVTGVPRSLSLPAGLRVQSVPGPGEQPQTFETVEALADARPAWNGIRPWSTQRVLPGPDATFMYIQGVDQALRPGDALVFLGDEFRANPRSNAWDFRILDAVDQEPAANRTRVSWKRGLGSRIPPGRPAKLNVKVYVLRRRAAAFGHNAPMWGSLSPEFRTTYPGTSQGDWPNFVLSPAGWTPDGGHVDLDRVYPEVQEGGYVVLAKGGFDPPSEPYVELFEVLSAAEVSRAEFAMSGKVTRLQLRGANYDTRFHAAVRDTTVFAASEALDFADSPVIDDVAGDRIPVDVSADGLLPGRRLLVLGRRRRDDQPVVAEAELVAARPVAPARCELEIRPPLAEPLRRGSVVVHANVARASHGASASQVLGSGDASRSHQRFELKQLPVTYRAAEGELGAAAELQVRVGDVAWRERATMFGASPTERAFTLGVDERGRQVVAFGDGVRGARLPTGTNNVRAAYRSGLGAAGKVAADQLTQLMSRPLGLKSVSNPLPAEGGTDPEPPEEARRSMPLYTRTLGRAVSVLDYEDFARAFSGVAKAQARVLELPGGSAVAITLAGPGGAALSAASPVWQHLLGALRSSGDPHVPVILLPYRASTFRIGIRVAIHPDRERDAVLAGVESALRSRFAFGSRALGQAVHQSEVVSTAQAVPGVVAVELTRLYGGTEPAAQTAVSRQARLLASRMRVEGGVAQPAELLTLAPGPLDEREEMT